MALQRNSDQEIFTCAFPASALYCCGCSSGRTECHGKCYVMSETKNPQPCKVAEAVATYGPATPAHGMPSTIKLNKIIDVKHCLQLHGLRIQIRNGIRNDEGKINP